MLNDDYTPSEIAQALRPSERKALLSREGQGDYSSATFGRLRNLRLVDKNFYLTDRGCDVRNALRMQQS